MTEVLKKAITSALKKEFSFPIYAEEVSQGSEQPCFCLSLTKMEEKRLLNFRRERKQYFSITFFDAESENKKESMAKVADKLYEVLCLVGRSEEMFAAGSMQHEILEDRVRFTVSYGYHVILEDDTRMMERLEYNGGKAVGYEEEE